MRNFLNKSEKLNAVLNFEMIGYYSERNNSQSLPAGFNIAFPDAYNKVAVDTFKGNFITNVGNVNSSTLVNNNVALYLSSKIPQQLGQTICAIGFFLG